MGEGEERTEYSRIFKNPEKNEYKRTGTSSNPYIAEI